MYPIRTPKLTIKGSLSTNDPCDLPVLIIGQLPHLLYLKFEDVACKLKPRVNPEDWQAALNILSPSPTDICPLYQNVATIAALPWKCSRHNTPSRSHSITKLVKSHSCNDDECIVMVCSRETLFASVCAIARAYPSFTRKTAHTSSGNHSVTIEILLVDSPNNEISNEEIQALTDACEGIRLAAHIVDTPCNEMNTESFLREIQTVAGALQIEPFILKGDQLAQRGMGGIYSVGKAAAHPPILAVLSHTPSGATESIAWVGKGIVFDTGGLSMKTKTSMPGMKRDCGGAAAVLGAFYAAVKCGFSQNLHAIFCLAENAVGPNATRPDDIITLYSGRSVEVNDTDAEGRLVLGDGVVYAAKTLQCNTVLDMATLTGAQGISTGKYHGAILTNDEQWETIGVEAGRISGDLLHPLPYTPELHFSEFASSVADMKNSVADRSNALSSCAGLFIASHLGFDFQGSWIHVDMASPVESGERATGYGVALLLSMFSQMGTNPLIKSLSKLNSSLSNNGALTDEKNVSKKIGVS